MQYEPRHVLQTEMCTPPGYYEASSDNALPMFWDNVSVPSSRVKKIKKKMTLNS
jgi:hypothetical protein